MPNGMTTGSGDVQEYDEGIEFTDDELETILAIARNGQSGRITEYEIKVLVAAYRAQMKE